MYSYLLPAELIGIRADASSEQIEDNLDEFNSILKTFEVHLIDLKNYWNAHCSVPTTTSLHY